MSIQDDFEERLRKYEEEGTSLSEEEMKWYETVKAAAMAEGELKIKSDLEAYYSEYQKNKKNRIIKFSVIGIAASVILGLFVFYNLQKDPSNPVQLQQNDQPVFSDSATYDSSRLEHIRKNEQDSVDKGE